MSLSRDLSASVHARLLSRAREEERAFNELLQYYVMERFLYPLSRSHYAGQFVLKGNLMLQYWSGTASRPTRDIDLLSNEFRTIEVLVQMIQECVETDVPADGLRFEAESVSGEETRAPAKYAGVRIQLIGYLGSARAHLQVDIGFGDVVTPGPEEVEYPTILDFDAPRLLAYTPETTIAEKVEAMVTLGGANTRFKDLYDIWKLSTQCSRRRGTELPRRIETLGAEFADQPQKPAQWAAFLRRAQADDCPTNLVDLQGELSAFLAPLLEQQERDSDTVWRPESGWVRK